MHGFSTGPASGPINAIAIRSRIVLEIAGELVAGDDRSLRLAEVRLGGKEPLALSSASNLDAIRRVAEGKVDLAMANPSAALMLAYKGRGPFKSPQPVRTIAVIPSPDQYVFAVRSDLGITAFEQIAAKRPALKLSVRGTADHCLHSMLDDIAAAAGFTLADLQSWGGEVRREGETPPRGAKLSALARGEINAIFDEGAPRWIDAALDAGANILPLSETTVRKLEAMGYRRAVLQKEMYRKLPADVLTIDFSGWPIFVHAELPDTRVTQICAALEARKDAMPWPEKGFTALADMCRDIPAAPVTVPFHPAAERFWRERGYIA